MDDMIIFTPINSGSSALEFQVPLFKLDPAYAGQKITVDLFDPGDVSGGNAYMGLQLPGSTSWATATSMTLLGTSLQAGGTTAVASLGNWPNGNAACSACFQTANGGGVIYNGQWIKLQITVPQTFNSGSYWNLVYYVAANVTSADTFAVQVGFNGTPDHLLP
jgi:hypothetical protein